MNGILGMANLLQSTRLTEEQRRYVDALSRPARRCWR